MKTKDYLLYAVVILLYGLGMFFLTKIAKANIIYNDSGTNLLIEYQTKTKPSAGPKSSYQKYAAVEFIVKTNKVTLDSNNDNLDDSIKDSSCGKNEILVNGVCMSKTDCQNTYPLTSVSSEVGSYISADCSGGSTSSNNDWQSMSSVGSMETFGKGVYSIAIKHCYTRCNNGWTQNGCYCNENSCDGYPLSTSTSCLTSDSCKNGSSYMYKCTACSEGYTLNAGVCIATSRPADCPYDSKPSESKGAVASKTYGNKVCYYYTSCYEGYSGPAGGDCTAKSCDRTVYPYNVLSGSSSSAGVLISCKSGENTYWGYTRCNEGWILSGARCLENECTGYGSGTAVIAHCNTSASCRKGSTKVYKCTSCQNGYGVNSSGLCEVITCPTGQINIYTYWCSDDWRCLMPGG